MIPFNPEGLMADVCRIMELLEPTLARGAAIDLGPYEPGPELIRMGEYSAAMGKAFQLKRERDLIKLLYSGPV